MGSPAAAGECRTARLLLRRWRLADREAFAALNADPEVMTHYPAPLDQAASDALADGFGRLGLAEVVSFTAAGNRRSRAVMERLGMRRDPAEDFEHPALPAGHALRRHVLYRLARVR